MREKKISQFPGDFLQVWSSHIISNRELRVKREPTLCSGLVVKALVTRAEDPGIKTLFARSSHTSDLDIGSLVPA